jgi:hypothetical protein
VELDILAECWRKGSREDTPPELEARTLMQLLTHKADDVRRDARRRLRREATYYLPMLIISVAGLADGLGLKNVLMMGGVAVLLGGIIVTLWHAERRLADATLARSVRETLADLVSTLDAAGRAYLTAYVAMFVVTVSIVASVVWFRHGLAPGFLAVLVLGGGAIIWSYWNGRAYVERMFRDDRAELAECLRQLESQ